MTIPLNYRFNQYGLPPLEEVRRRIEKY